MEPRKGSETMKFIDYIKRRYGILFSILFFLLAVNALGSTWLMVTSPYHRMWSFLISAACCVLGVVLMYYAYHNRSKAARMKSFIKQYEIWILLVICIVTISIQMYIILRITQPIGWDVGAIYRIASQLYNRPITSIDYNYLQSFPNNMSLTFFFSTIIRIAKHIGMNPYILLNIMNVIAVDAAAFLLFYNCKKIAGIVCAYMALFIFILLLGFSGWISVPYSDTLSILFPMLILCLYMQMKNHKKIYHKVFFAVLIGFVTMQGYYLKPTNIFILIAIALCEFITFLTKYKKVKVYFISVLCVISGIIISASIHKMEVRATFPILDKSKEIPMTHFFMMGLDTRKLRNGKLDVYGGFNDKDYAITRAQPTYEAKIKKNIEVSKERIKDMGAVGYLRFLRHKANWILGDGTFYWQNEGGFYIPEKDVLPVSKQSENIRNIYDLGTHANKIVVTLQQGAWMAILLMIPFAALKREEKEKGYIFILQITVTGIILFLLLFEARSRYLINHLPFFIMLSTIGLKNLMDFIMRRKYGTISIDKI